MRAPLEKVEVKRVVEALDWLGSAALYVALFSPMTVVLLAMVKT